MVKQADVGLSAYIVPPEYNAGSRLRPRCYDWRGVYIRPDQPGRYHHFQTERETEGERLEQRRTEAYSPLVSPL